MRGRMIAALLRKDLVMFFSNRFFALITVLGLVFYAAVYFLMPAEVEEWVELAIFALDPPAQLFKELREEGVILQEYGSEEALREAIRSGEQEVGAVFPEDFTVALAGGETAVVHLLFSPGFPDEFKAMYQALFQEIGFMLSGRPLNVEVHEEILGVDRAGEQVPYRERMLPLFIVFILLMETMGLANLIANEIAGGTLSALLVTPLKVEGLFLSKGIFGVGMALIQATLLLAITGGLMHQPLLIMVILLLGSIMIAGLGFLIASVSKDLMSVMGWSMLVILVLALPAFSILLPGTTTAWVRIIPSYHLVHPMHQVINYGWGWADAGGNLLVLAAFSVLFLALGIAVLRRKFR